MAKFTYEDLEKAEQRRAAAQERSNSPRVSYFALKHNGDEAIVRFLYTDVDQFDFMSVHQVKVGNSFRRVNCLRTPKEPVDKCPFCASDDQSISKVYSKFYVKLLEYVKDENGKIVAMPRIWERPTSFAKTLASYFLEYGDLSDCVFKVRRHGDSGSRDTTYDLVLANPAVYKAEVYEKDMNAFDNYSLTKYVVLDKTADDMRMFLDSGEFAEEPKQEQPVAQASAPVQAAAPAAPVVESVRPEPVQATQSEETTNRPRRYTF